MTTAMATSGHVPEAGWSVRVMRCCALVLLGVVALPFNRVEAQRDRRVGGVPRDVALEVTRTFNAPGTRRVRGDFALSVSDTVRGDLAVLNGHVRLAGVVQGDVVVLNGDATLLDGARIDRSLTVLGGTFDSPERPNVGGEIRVWSARYRYHEAGDTLVADTDFLTRFSQWVRDDDDSGTQSQLFVTTAHTYNRVEGLPIYVGPRLRSRSGDTRVRAELFGIFRTGDGLVWKDDNLGHRALFEVRQGNSKGVAIGGRLFDEVDAVERWQLTDAEVGLNTFLFSRDYRDYWERHGGQGYIALFAGRGHELKASVGEERWNSRLARDVWRLNDGIALRPNVQSDEGVVRLVTVSGTFDTRTNSRNPRSGWYLRGEFELGTSDALRSGELSPGVRPLPGPADAQLARTMEYSRAFFDLRRYSRLGPNAQINFRAVFGGWVDGDPLPIQRRVSVSGIDALPGFDFRRTLGTNDVGTCATDEAAYAALGRPAQCERMALAQVEWKGDFRINLFGDDDDYGDQRWGVGRMRADGTWVLFANSGRGWLIDHPPTAGANTPAVLAAAPLRYGKSDLPDLGSWRTDIGGGFDFGDFGVYVAQAVSQGGLSPNVYVRLSRRF